MTLDKINDVAILKKFNDYLHQKTGFIFEEKDLDKLNNRINKRTTDLSINNLDNYYDFLIRNENELLELINHIIINETTFFRHEEHYAIIVAKLKEELKDNPNKYRFINILSAGCSTGEEPYSIAMYLKKNLPESIFNIVRITAFDISSFNIRIATAGKYPTIKTEKIKEKIFLNLYFRELPNDEGYEIKPEIKNIINCSVGNLFNVELKKKNYNFIFSGNVMIYFSCDKRRQVLEKFYNALNNNGIFFVAPTESLLDAKDLFERCRMFAATYYQKKTDETKETRDKKSAALAAVNNYEKKSFDNIQKSAGVLTNKEFAITMANVRRGYLEIEFSGKFEDAYKTEIINELKKILQKQREYNKLILIMNNVNYIDVSVLKEIGKVLKTNFSNFASVLLTTNKEQLLRIFEFHKLEEYFELL